MKQRRLLSVLIMVVCATTIGFIVSRNKPTLPSATVHFAGVEPSTPFGPVCKSVRFHVTNMSERSITLVNPVVDLRDSNGWHIDRKWVRDWQSKTLEPFGFCYLVVNPCDDAINWRLRMSANRQTHGLRAWLRRTICRWPPFKGTGIVTQELVSEEINQPDIERLSGAAENMRAASDDLY